MNWNKSVRQVHRWLSIAFTGLSSSTSSPWCRRSLPSGWASWRCSRSPCSCSPACTCSCCRMPRGGAASDAPAAKRDAMTGKTSRTSARVANEAPPPGGSPKSRPSSQAATLRSPRQTATPPCRPTSRPCRAGNATWDATSTRSSCAPFPACASSQMELAALRSRGPGLVPRHPLLHELRQSGFLPRHVAASCPPRRVQEQGHALPRHP